MNSTRIRRLAAALAFAIALAAPSAASADLRGIGIGTSNTIYAGVLDVAGGSTAAGAKVIQYPVTGGANQRWDFVSSHFINQKSGLCLTTSGVAGQQLYVTYCNASNPRQNWSFTDGQPFAKRHSIYNSYSRLHADVQGGSTLAGTPIVGWTATGGDNQQFAYWYWN